MSLTETIVEGTLQPDGSLELDEKPNIPSGRVTVTVRQTSPGQVAKGNWWEFMQNARKQMEEAGCHFMNEKEMQDQIEWMREGDRIDELLKEGNEQNRQPEQR